MEAIHCRERSRTFSQRERSPGKQISGMKMQ
jgi:hypothetical protein